MKKYINLLISICIVFIFFTIYFISNKKENNLKHITIAEVTHSIFYAPQYVADSKGYFKEEGLDIEIILTSGADNVMAAVLSGDADIGLSGSEATIYIYNGGEKDYIKTFAQLTQKDGSFIVSRKKIDNFTLNDLKGKYIIGGRLGGMPEMTLEYSLKQNNINLNELTIDTDISFQSMASAFINGTGDFVNLFEPLATQVANQGYGYIVASLGEYGGIVPYTAYNARTSYIENNSDVIEKFTKAINKALDYVNNHNEKEIAQDIISYFPDTKFEDLENAIKSYKNINAWPQNTTFTKESFNHLQDIVIEAGLLKEKVKYNDLIYTK